MGFIQLRDDVKQARETRDIKGNQLVTVQEEVKILYQQLNAEKAAGDDTTATENNLNTKQADKAFKEGEYTNAKSDETLKYTALVNADIAKNQIEELDENFPILLFPVRIETRFFSDGYFALRIRFYPDDIAMQTLEKPITEKEYNDGLDYWSKHGSATEEENKIGIWDGLCLKYGHTRAAWIVLKTEGSPSTYDQKSSSWTQQPLTRIMPDRFVVKLYDNSGAPIFEAEGNAIPDLLKAGVNPDEDSITNDNGVLDVDNEIDWMFDFSRAVQNGMAIEIGLTEAQHNAGFSKLIAVGVKTSSDETIGQNLVEQLFDNHHYTNGMSILKQGTATKNSSEGRSGYSSFEYGNNLSYSVEREDDLLTPNIKLNERDKLDGQVLAEALGISYATLDHIHRADGKDIQDARRFANMTFQGVLGSFMTNAGFAWKDYESIEKVRKFFVVDYVSARGVLPSFRVGTVPYGIVPATDIDNVEKRPTNPRKDFFGDVRDVLRGMEIHWNNAISRIPGAEGLSDGNQEFVNFASNSALGNNYHTRMAMGPLTTWNTLNLKGDTVGAANWFTAQTQFAANLKNTSAIPLEDNSRIGMTNFSIEHGDLQLPLIQDEILSSTEPLVNMPGGSMNYLEWLSIASLKDILEENFVASGASNRPNSLLFEIAKKSILLDYRNSAANYLGLDLEARKDHELINTPIQTTQSQEVGFEPYNFFPPFAYYHGENPPAYSYFQCWDKLMKVIKAYLATHLNYNIIDWNSVSVIAMDYDNNNPGESPSANTAKMGLQGLINGLGMYDSMNNLPPQPPGYHFNQAVKYWKGELTIYPDPWEILNYTFSGVSMGNFLGNVNNIGDPEREGLDSAREDLAYLKNTPSADLDLLFRGVMDVASDRFDAWKLGLYTEHLLTKRFDSLGNRITGTYIGAYGWLLELKPKSESDFVPNWSTAQNNAFTSNHGNNVLKDLTNKGFIWTPSLAQASTAALLRSGFTVNANINQPNFLGINMTSERIRIAEEIMQGVRNGQHIGALLGYRLERWIQDSSNVANTTIYDLRRDFPIADNSEGQSNEEKDSIAARNVIDGAKLLEVYTVDPSLNQYNPTLELVALINRLVSNRDALGDYMVCQGAFYIAKGNMDAAKAWIDVDLLSTAPADGHFFKTPRSGTTFTAKSILNVEYVEYDPDAENISLRAHIEPSLNAWCNSEIGPLSGIGFSTRYMKADGLTYKTEHTLNDLRYGTTLTSTNSIPISSLDLVLMTNDTLAFDGSELSTLIKDYLIEYQGALSIVEVDFSYGPGNTISYKKIYPMLRQMKKVLMQSRVLSPNDLKTPGVSYDDILVNYNITDLETRVEKVYDLFNSFDSYFNVEIIPSSSSLLKTKLRDVSQFGILNALGQDLDNNFDTVFKQVRTEYVYRKGLIPNTFPVKPSGTDYGVIDNYVKTLVSIADVIFGELMILLPCFTNPSEASLSGQVNSNTLLTGITDSTYINDSWLHSISRVRPSMSDMEWLSALKEAVFNLENGVNLKAFQIPYSTNDIWMLLPMEKSKMKNNVLSIALFGHNNWGSNCCGFLIDDWSETIPDEEETTGIALNFDQPKAKAPQALILASSPTNDGNWSWDDLITCVNGTYTASQQRGVAYTQLVNDLNTPIGQLLPALELKIQQIVSA